MMNVKQREGESIRSYLDRFNAVVLKVRNLDQSVAMAVLKGGVLKNGLRYSSILLEEDLPLRLRQYAGSDREVHQGR